MKRFVALASLVTLAMPLHASGAPALGDPSTTLTVILSTAIEQLQVGGDLTPDHFGDTVTLTQYKRKDGAWKQIATADVEMEDLGTAGDFVTTFALLKKGRCKIKAYFAGDEDHLPSTGTSKYHCSGAGLEGPARA